MLSLDLVNEVKIPHFKLVKLMPKELFYIRLPSLKDLSEEITIFLQKVTFLSSEVILSIPAEDFAVDELRKKYLSLGIKGFAIRATHQVEKWLKHQGIGQIYSGDRDLMDMFHRYRSILEKDKDLIVEFQIESDLRILGPTITGIVEMGAKWVVLNVEGEPTNKRCLEFRDVFEYLKIRGCTKLNVYFPFWNRHFREWDIKTQNTFSGIRDVHIDISNRCTHSCVFCGLYGPEAIEETKKRSGGDELPEVTKNHMKMEIDPQVCHEIIQSLPWSVSYLQFGGMGDPLMHEHSVDFIAAARERGFKIEVLSNMEYLDDEDIHRLHRLGGEKSNDLHFIANISAGNPELYIQTRPRQTIKNYEKVLQNLSLFSKLRQENNGTGVSFTIMCVVNKLNCLHLKEVSELAYKLGAQRVWFKPMEIHGDVHHLYIPKKEVLKAMANSLKEAIHYAMEKDIIVFQKEYCDQIINKYSGDLIDVTSN
jgi:MoaA/NifB/PqqE/SkfB family radical SAM enzyme